MKFSPQVGQQIIFAINAKMPGMTLSPCPLCRTTAWELLDAFVAFSIAPEPQAIVLGGQILPCVALICKTCGNTHFLNLNRLGLGHLLTPEPQPPTKEQEGLAALRQLIGSTQQTPAESLESLADLLKKHADKGDPKK
jgi:hypothetical protein